MKKNKPVIVINYETSVRSGFDLPYSLRGYTKEDLHDNPDDPAFRKGFLISLYSGIAIGALIWIGVFILAVIGSNEIMK
ncbi:MAG TPA: hypothetical protein VFD46_07075 [Chryseolinea sp.]|nr:hypothetical protein [Chryseolinea sp.]